MGPLSLLLCVGSVFGQQSQRVEDAGLVSPLPNFQDVTGKRVAISGDWIFVSSELSNIGATNAGAVLPFLRTAQGYEAHAPILAPVPIAAEVIGRNGIDASGATLAVASRHYPNPSIKTGRVIMYDYDISNSMWTYSEFLEPGMGHAPGNTFFGWDVELIGGELIVGAPGLGTPFAGGGASERGGFFCYSRQGAAWVLSQVWQAPVTVAAFSGVGADLTTDGVTLVSRGFGYDKAFVFEKTGLASQWQMVQELVSPVPGINDEDGLAMDVDGDTMVFGGEHNDFQLWGRVSTYRKIQGQWVFDSMLQASDSGGLGDGFGVSVDLDGDRLIVGARGAWDANSGTRRGAAYVYERDAQGSWVEKHKLVKAPIPSGAGLEYLGESVALGRNFAVVGDKFHTVLTTDEGGAFAYDLPMGQTVCDGVANSTGSQAGLEVLGSSLADQGFVRLRAMGLPQGLAGLFLGSQSTSFTANPGGSRGNLCLGGAISRFNRYGQYGTPQGDGSYELQIDTTNLPYSPGIPILAGQTWAFQMWYRDLDQGQTTNFTSAVEVLFE